MPASHPEIAIIGAGISGLVLGRCLVRRGFRPTIYEKARQSLHRNNYGITLQPWAYQSLLQDLNIDEKEFRRETAVDGKGRVDSGEEGSLRANRRILESLLSQGLNVQWEHEVASVELGRANSEAITLKLGDGKEVSTPVIVGADGPHSVLRAAIAADVDFEILPFAVYNGRRSYNTSQFEEVLGSAFENVSALEHRTPTGVLLQISINARGSEKVEISYTFSRRSRRDDNTEDALFRPERAKSAARDIPEALFIELADLIANHDLPPAFKAVFDPDAVREDRLLNWLMRSLSVPASELQHAAKRGVVLIGDAAHAEPILGGLGANHAILESVALAEYITQNQGRDLSHFYELGRTQDREESVKQCESRIRKMHEVQGRGAQA